MATLFILILKQKNLLGDAKLVLLAILGGFILDGMIVYTFVKSLSQPNPFN